MGFILFCIIGFIVYSSFLLVLFSGFWFGWFELDWNGMDWIDYMDGFNGWMDVFIVLCIYGYVYYCSVVDRYLKIPLFLSISFEKCIQ